MTKGALWEREKEIRGMACEPSMSLNMEKILEDVPAHMTTALVIDTQALQENYQFLQKKIGSSQLGAVVKADAYGLGLEGILPSLQKLGCQDYFVAHPHEGKQVREWLRSSHDVLSRVYVLAGISPPLLDMYRQYDLIPVLNDRSQIDHWCRRAQEEGVRLPAVIQLDTGLTRNGLDEKDVALLKENPHQLQNLHLLYWLTHLARSKEGERPENQIQLDKLKAFLKGLPIAPVSLASSAGIFLGDSYHFHLSRVATALFGMRPLKDQPNPMRPVVSWYGRILQIRTLPKGEPVGYGASYVCARESRLATVGIGYGDGYVRGSSLKGRKGFIRGKAVPLVGKVSMDYTVFDVTDLTPYDPQPGTWIELAGPHLPIDELADTWGTVAYEILTQVRGRTYRLYV